MSRNMTDEEIAVFVRVFDSGPDGPVDRYTVVYPDGDYVAMDDRPFWPQGFCQHGPGIIDDEFLAGQQQIAFAELPEDCKAVVRRDMGYEEVDDEQVV